jgi:hypothetical protein
MKWIIKALGGILVIGDILYVWHLGFNSATFSDWGTVLWIIGAAIIGIALIFV